MQLQPVLDIGVVVFQPFASRATIDVVRGQIGKILLAKAAPGLGARGHRFRQSHGDAGLITRDNLRAAEVAAIGNRLQGISLQPGFGFLGNTRELCAVGADIGHLVRDDQIMLGVDSHLHLLCELGELLLEPRGLRSRRLRWLLPVGTVELAQITGDALLKLRSAPFHLRPGEFRSRLFTALNLLPSIATLAFTSRPICRQSSTKRARTWRIARPLSFRKSATVWSGAKVEKALVAAIPIWFGLVADVAYGSAENLAWLVHERGIAPHIPVFDKSQRSDGTFSRDDFAYHHKRDCYILPCRQGTQAAPKIHRMPRPFVDENGIMRYRVSKLDCEGCSLKPQCCPNAPARKILRSIHEGARDMARNIASTDAYAASRRERKKIEMLFAHLKRILKLDRLRLRGPNGARDEFYLAATAQNLRKLAMLIPMAAPTSAT